MLTNSLRLQYQLRSWTTGHRGDMCLPRLRGVQSFKPGTEHCAPTFKRLSQYKIVKKTTRTLTFLPTWCEAMCQMPVHRLGDSVAKSLTLINNNNSKTPTPLLTQFAPGWPITSVGECPSVYRPGTTTDICNGNWRYSPDAFIGFVQFSPRRMLAGAGGVPATTFCSRRASDQLLTARAIVCPTRVGGPMTLSHVMEKFVVERADRPTLW